VAADRTIVLRPGRLFDLDRPGWWRVAEGGLDLFVELAPADGAGAFREHLGTVAEGEPVAGVEGGPARLLARGHGRTVLEPIRGAEAVSPEAVEGWLGKLLTPLGRRAPSIDAVDRLAAPGDTVRLAAGERLAARDGVVWVRADASALLLGRLPAGGDEDGGDGDGPRWLPLTSRVWLTAGRGVEVTARSTAEVAGEPGAFAGCGTPILALLAELLDAERRREAERLAARSSLVARERGAVLERFGAVIDRRERRIDPALPPLVQAVQRIGRELGVAVEAPAPGTAAGKSTAARVEALARRSRLRARRVVLRERWWRRETRPMLAFRRDGGEPLALLPGRGRRLCWTPGTGAADGELRRVTPALAAEIEPVAYSFYRTLPDRPVGSLGLLAFAARRGRRDLLAALAFGGLGMVMAMLVPLAVAVVVDVAIPAHQRSQLVAVALGLAVAAFATLVFRVCEDVALLRLEGKATEAVQPAILDRLLRLPNTFFRRYPAGDLAERVQGIDLLQSRLSGAALSTLLGGVLSLLNLAVLFFLEPRSALVATALLAFLFAVLAVTVHRQVRRWSEVYRLEGKLTSLVLQLIAGIHRVRIAGAEDRLFVLWGKSSMDFRDLLTDCYNAQLHFNTFVRGFGVLAFAVVFAALALLGGGGLTTGATLAFLAAFALAVERSTALARTAVDLTEVMPTHRRLRPILEGVPESEERAHPGVLGGRIEVADVCFRYGEGMPWVLEGVSLAVEPGENVALVGPSGCGKSTLFRLLLGFERPSSGGIYYDGKELSGLDLRELRHQIGVVLQRDSLMAATIYDNIRGDSDASLEEAWEAARRSGIAEEIEAMPLGMHTVVAAEGSDLSGGQVQRLLIARALAARPRILLLDEATSALDNRSQAAVTDSLDRLRVTRIVIAHRLSTVRRADRIHVLEEGRIVESGGYDELLERGGFFAELVRRQLE